MAAILEAPCLPPPLRPYRNYMTYSWKCFHCPPFFAQQRNSHYYKQYCYTSTLLANMKAYSRTASSHIKVKRVLTIHKRLLPALKIRKY